MLTMTVFMTPTRPMIALEAIESPHPTCFFCSKAKIHWKYWNIACRRDPKVIINQPLRTIEGRIGLVKFVKKLVSFKK